MIAQDVIWTALPNGRKDATTLKLSVYISPRLMTDQGLPTPMLSQFKDFLNWPTVPVSYKVIMGSHGPFTGTIVTSPPAVNNLYTAVFKTTTFVRPHQFPTGLASSVRIRSYPVRQLRGFVKNAYTNAVTNSPTDHPPVAALDAANSFGSIGFVANQIGGLTGEQREAQLAAQLESILQQKQWVDFTQFNPSDPNYNALAFLLAKRFHQPRSGVTEAPTDPVTLTKPTLGAAGPAKAIDYHQMITLASEHPALMRYLGLVVDLEFQPTGVPAGTTTVRVVPTWTPQLAPPATNNYSPKTRCTFSSTAFAAAPRTVNPELANGALPLDDPTRFEFVEIDHDGAALKAMHFANNIQRSMLPEHVTQDTPQSFALPSLRSGGLSVARVGMAGQLLANIQTSSNLNGTFKTGATLNAEDLIRGYAVHIWDSASGHWRSLLNRTGSYNFVDIADLVPVTDEGAVSLGPTSDPLNPSPDLYQQETLFLWSGWSLAAQRPGNTLVTDPAHDPKGPMQRIDSTADADFRVQIRYKVTPNTLPRLRFGTAYRIRARAVDLAGNRIPFGDPSAVDPHASPTITYSRFEPVDSPVVLLRRPRTPGESAEKIVIRSNYNTPPPVTATSQRHISPTKIAEMVAEEHGLFDTPSVIDPLAFSKIVARDDKSYATSPQAKIDPFDYQGTQYFDVNTLLLQFFPDPIGRGASFLSLPGLPVGSITQMTYLPSASTMWPAYVPFRFILQEGSGAPVTDVVNRTLTVQIPKAQVVTVRYSSYIDASDLALLGIWNWLPAATQATLQAAALNGQIWALTPWRNLTLIHAVRQPLLNPKFLSLPGPFRDTIGQTFAFFTSTSMSTSRSSTGGLKVYADWNEAVDAGPASSVDPTHSKKTAVAFQVDLTDPLAGGASDTVLLQNERQEFHDTKFRHVSYRAVATSTFVEYFQQTVTVTLSGTTAVLVHAKGFAPETVKVKTLDGKTTFVRDVDYVADDVAGTVARTTTSRITDGGQVLADYVAPPVDRPSPGEAPIVSSVDIPNSARPAAPDVLYIVPTWKWASKPVTGGTQSSRTGGGLRVYMNRPWWSSGDGELLGVLLWPFIPGGPPEPPDSLKPYVSRWGIDPIHASNATTQPPVLTQFPLRTTSSSTPLSLEELNDQPAVLVAGHNVGFDTVRKLWYADIAVNTGTPYFPFVRLALARYQPKSLINAHLSRAVLADFVQTAQGRTFTFVRSTGNPNLITVTAVGISYGSTQNADGSPRTGPSRMRVQVEQRSHKLAGELGWEAVGSPVILSPSQAAGFQTTWIARILLPSGNWPLRLVVEEVEELSQDGGAFGPATGERLVYTDIVPVSADQFGILTPTPSSVNFGAVAANGGIATATVTVTNTGTAPVQIGAAVGIIGPDAAQFGIDVDNASGKLLNPSQSGSVGLHFAPTAVGTFNAQLDIPNDSLPSPLDVNLTGVGQGAVLGVSPNPLAFGNQPVGVTSPRVALTLTNTGNANLVIGTTSITGPNAGDFAIAVDSSGQTLPPGGIFQMSLTVKPSTTGAKSATLSIPSNAVSSNQPVGLSANGV
jgi:hypothetical protein